MVKDRKLIAIIPYYEVDWVFVSNFWDINLEGTCIYNGMLCDFETIDNPDVDMDNIMVLIYKLSTIQRMNRRIRKTMFEWFVSTSWSYKDGKKVPRRFRPDWSKKIYYKIIKNILVKY